MDARSSATRFGFWAALATAALTVVTFGFAITAIPDAGRNCQENCATYPFASNLIARQFPGDYLWMIPAMVLMLAFVALIAAVHHPRRPTTSSSASSGSAWPSSPRPCC